MGVRIDERDPTSRTQTEKALVYEHLQRLVDETEVESFSEEELFDDVDTEEVEDEDEEDAFGDLFLAPDMDDEED
jgi:hypothetical protein